MEMDKELIDKLLGDYQKPEDLIGENGLLKQLTRALVERALQAELTTHLGYEKHSPEGHLSGNSRNGASTKQLNMDFECVPAVRAQAMGREPLISREFPRLCRGGSNSLTFPGVHPETLRCEPPSTHQGETGWTSMKA